MLVRQKGQKGVCPLLWQGKLLVAEGSSTQTPKSLFERLTMVSSLPSRQLLLKEKGLGEHSSKESLQPEMIAFLLSAAIWQRWKKAGRPQAESKKHLQSHAQENHNKTVASL